MSAHVLLNLLNELGKRDKMRGLPSILSIFRNEFNKFNNTGALMLDSIYHMTNTLKSHFWRKNVIILSLCTQRCYERHNVSRKSINLMVYRFYCMALFHSQTRRHMIKRNNKLVSSLNFWPGICWYVALKPRPASTTLPDENCTEITGDVEVTETGPEEQYLPTKWLPSCIYNRKKNIIKSGNFGHQYICKQWKSRWDGS